MTPANGYDPQVIIGRCNNDQHHGDYRCLDAAVDCGPNMSQARIEMNAVILPNGKVLALGDHRPTRIRRRRSKNAELYNLATNTFTTMAPNVYPRLYHSNALLLPDATVWVAGSNPAFDGVYEKHWIFISLRTCSTRAEGRRRGRRVTSVQASVSWGNSFRNDSDAARCVGGDDQDGSPTHAFDGPAHGGVELHGGEWSADGDGATQPNTSRRRDNTCCFW
jgi:hypothetical protein